MKSALEDLKLERLFVVVPGREIYPLHEKVTVLGLPQLGRLPTMLATASTRS